MVVMVGDGDSDGGGDGVFITMWHHFLSFSHNGIAPRLYLTSYPTYASLTPPPMSPSHTHLSSLILHLCLPHTLPMPPSRPHLCLPHTPTYASLIPTYASLTPPPMSPSHTPILPHTPPMPPSHPTCLPHTPPMPPSHPHLCLPHAPTYASLTPPPMPPSHPHLCLPHTPTYASLTPPPMPPSHPHLCLPHTPTYASLIPPPMPPSHPHLPHHTCSTGLCSMASSPSMLHPSPTVQRAHTSLSPLIQGCWSSGCRASGVWCVCVCMCVYVCMCVCACVCVCVRAFNGTGL